jgi:hypothetical protein
MSTEKKDWLEASAVTAVLESKETGQKLQEGIVTAVSALDALQKCGLTGEALTVLVTEKTARARNGTRIQPDTVEKVLKGLFKLKEYLR